MGRWGKKTDLQRHTHGGWGGLWGEEGMKCTEIARETVTDTKNEKREQAGSGEREGRRRKLRKAEEKKETGMRSWDQASKGQETEGKIRIRNRQAHRVKAVAQNRKRQLHSGGPQGHHCPAYMRPCGTSSAPSSALSIHGHAGHSEHSVATHIASVSPSVEESSISISVLQRVCPFVLSNYLYPSP